VIAAVDAGRMEAILVRHRPAVGRAEEPLGVGLEDGLGSPAEVEPADDPYAPVVGLSQGLAEKVTARRQGGASGVELDLGGGMGDDAPAGEEQRIGREGGDLANEPYRVEARIGFP